MSKYIVEVESCDASSYVDVELSDEQAEGFRIVAAATVERRWTKCYPVMTITPYASASDYARESAEETRGDED